MDIDGVKLIRLDGTVKLPTMKNEKLNRQTIENLFSYLVFFESYKLAEITRHMREKESPKAIPASFLG